MPQSSCDTQECAVGLTRGSGHQQLCLGSREETFGDQKGSSENDSADIGSAGRGVHQEVAV